MDPTISHNVLCSIDLFELLSTNRVFKCTLELLIGFEAVHHGYNVESKEDNRDENDDVHSGKDHLDAMGSVLRFLSHFRHLLGKSPEPCVLVTTILALLFVAFLTLFWFDHSGLWLNIDAVHILIEKVLLQPKSKTNGEHKGILEAENQVHECLIIVVF